MTNPIWSRSDLLPVDHRIIWWLIDAGIVKGALKRGWIKRCAWSLGIHTITMNRRLKHLESVGVLRRVDSLVGIYELNDEVFVSGVDESEVSLRETK